MTKAKRDYCQKGSHPHWRAWKARYDMTAIAWPWLGNFCDYCGERVDGVGSGSPDARLAGRIRVLRGGAVVPHLDVAAYRDRVQRHFDESSAQRRKVVRFYRRSE